MALDQVTSGITYPSGLLPVLLDRACLIGESVQSGGGLRSVPPLSWCLPYVIPVAFPDPLGLQENSVTFLFLQNQDVERTGIDQLP